MIKQEHKKQLVVTNKMISTFFLTWNIFVASWKKDWIAQKNEIKKLDTHFERIPVTPAVMWNVIMFTLLQVSVVNLAKFSREFQYFSWMAVSLPCLCASTAYYCFKFGSNDVVSSLSMKNCINWINNWIAMQGISLACISQTMSLYVLGVVLERFLLPRSSQFSIRFPPEMYEECLRVSVYYFYTMGGVCLITLPLWKKGYHLSLQVAGRGVNSETMMSYTEILMELIYQTSQSCSPLFTGVAIMAILQNLGLRIHGIHIFLGVLEVVFFNYSVNWKFCILHQVMHEIKPLYAMAHLEHHICKGTFPTTSAVGLWESWLCGQANFFMYSVGITPLPYATLQSLYMGATPLGHTMWPSLRLMQWHTLHHTILADVYTINIPSSYDKQHSKMFHKLNDKLASVSPFVKHEALSDMVGFALMILGGIFFHYYLGIGIGHIDWSEVDWVYNQDIKPYPTLMAFHEWILVGSSSVA